MAAASALGVAIGLGVRGATSTGWATALTRLSVIVLRLRGLPEFVTPDRDGGLAALFGGVHLAIVAGLWGAAVGAVMERIAARGASRGVALLTTLASGAALAALDALLLPAPLRLAAGTLATAEWGLMAIVVTLAAGIGARSVTP